MRDINYKNVPVEIDDILDPRQFIIPSFQRDVKWSDTKKEEFIRNLLEGDPFGVLLIRIQEDGKYKLVDGLQRITTIQDFNKNPYKYLNYKDINPDLVDELIKMDRTEKNLQVTKEFIEQNREEWQKEIFKRLKDAGKDSDASMVVINGLQNDLNLNSNLETWNCVQKIIKDFEEFIDIGRLEVYAINYIGDDERLANVFDNLNTGGLKLTNYEEYSAEWSNNKFIVDDEKLIDIIVDRYKELEEKSGMDVDYSRADLMEEGINLYQYCRALGSIITSEEDDFDILFGATVKLVEKIGFEILALLIVGIVNAYDEMYEKLVEEYAVEGKFLLQLKEAIKESLEVIRDVLEPLLVGKNGSHLHSDNVYLTYHILVSYIKEYYVIDFEAGTVVKNRETNLREENFKKYMPLHYLHDCITEYWKDNRQANEINKAVADKTRRQKYWYDIPIEDWEEAIDKFMDSQETVGKGVPQKNKLFIDFLTKQKIIENRNYDKFFTEGNISNKKFPLDIEHIIAKKVLSDHIKELDEEEVPQVPISAVGNLCYLTAKSNRGKKYYTLHENMEGRPEYFMNPDFQDCILYPTEEELKFKDYDNERFFDEYDKFIDKRQAKLKEEFLKLI